ncbi:MAG: hypothetical protein LBO09_06805 [Candidatus Peribacteria bacterium]|jgi:hypothetical protein|nr:hypothetical protein [Candidatus Peribacteria bacterium]
MKKLAISLTSLVVGASAFVTAQSMPAVSDLAKDLPHGYTGASQVSFVSIDASEVKLESPLLNDKYGEAMRDYKISYSPYFIDDVDQAYLQLSGKDFRFTSANISIDGKVSFSLGVQDGVVATQSYYLVITPFTTYYSPAINDKNEIGIPSKQFCFNLAEARYGSGEDCRDFDTMFISTPTPAETIPTLSTTEGESTDSYAQHGAASTDWGLANVTHTISGNTITLRWTAVENGGLADLLLFDLQQEKFIRLATVKMSDERYDYTMTRDGQHLFRFRPLDGGKEVRYPVQAMKTDDTPPPPPKIEEVPKTGPVEDALGMVVIALLVYGGYKLYKKRYI